MAHHDPELLDLFRKDIVRQSSIVKEQIPEIRTLVDDAVAQLPPNPSQVFLVGCGDSLDGGVAVVPFWQKLFPGIAIEAVPAMTYSYYTVDSAPEGSLMIALSQSGTVTRVVEAVEASRARGLATLTVTAQADSPLDVSTSDASLVASFPKLGPIPGTTSFAVGSVILAEIAAALAGDAEAEQLRSVIDSLPEKIELAVEVSKELVNNEAEYVTRESAVLALAAGPSVAAARHFVRKVLETSQLLAAWQETEEYAHDEYSVVDERFLVVLFAPEDRSLVRTAEIAHYLSRLGTRLLVITSGQQADRFRASAAEVVEVVANPLIFPLVAAVPCQILAHSLAENLGGSMYGMGEVVHREDGDPQIYESAIVVP